ncbi:MAG: hypothetical protein J0L50_05035 [Sphingomonadales bacterium]|nr:hypothetical protein [Sphingomonadales bacterium]
MRRPISAGLALLVAVAAQALPLAAQEEALPKFYVYGEDDGTRELVECKATHASAVSAVQAELRAAGIAIQDDAGDPEAVMDVYVNVSAMPITGQSSCAYSLTLAFESFGEAPNPFTLQKEFSKLTYCTKGSLMVWGRGTAQAEINATFRRHTRDCLVKYKGRNAR